MGLAGKNDLDRPVGVGDQALESLEVGEHERCPLVGGEATGEAESEPIVGEHGFDLAQFLGRDPVAGDLTPQASPGEGGEDFLALVVVFPDVGQGQLGQMLGRIGILEQVGGPVLSEFLGQ